MKKYVNELKQKIEQANQILKDNNYQIEIVIVGGSSFVLKGLVPRATADIDSLVEIDAQVQALLKDVFDINSRVQQFEQNFGNWQDDLVIFESLPPLSNIEIRTISDERLIASRFFSRKRNADVLEAIKNIKSIDQNKFEEIITEVFGFSEPIYTKEFIENEYLMKNMYKTLGWNYEKSNIKNLYKK